MQILQVPPPPHSTTRQPARHPGPTILPHPKHRTRRPGAWPHSWHSFRAILKEPSGAGRCKRYEIAILGPSWNHP